MFHDVGRHVQEVALVLDRDQSPLSPVVHAETKRLNQRSQRLDGALDTHVAKHKQSWTDGSLSERRVTGDQERHAELALDPIV